ncbi:hypothetical protein BDN71DRAFT_1426497 [Pleurotus eryngii]|uniref:Uncharacterized protein n=1 Tax=Pleurotus eryngii TaxID=5323 RepID=A0A9P6A7I2_PLEER|nr:hypothetical protein BDN71DRAFT_1426497 [Pleurotus eryngii]
MSEVLGTGTGVEQVLVWGRVLGTWTSVLVYLIICEDKTKGLAQEDRVKNKQSGKGGVSCGKLKGRQSWAQVPFSVVRLLYSERKASADTTLKRVTESNSGIEHAVKKQLGTATQDEFHGGGNEGVKRHNIYQNEEEKMGVQKGKVVNSCQPVHLPTHKPAHIPIYQLANLQPTNLHTYKPTNYVPTNLQPMKNSTIQPAASTSTPHIDFSAIYVHLTVPQVQYLSQRYKIENGGSILHPKVFYWKWGLVLE